MNNARVKKDFLGGATNLGVFVPIWPFMRHSGVMTGHIGTNKPKFVPSHWGRPPFGPTQTGLCKFGWVWSSLKYQKILARKWCQYSSHLYRNMPPICIAIRLPFVSISGKILVVVYRAISARPTPPAPNLSEHLTPNLTRTWFWPEVGFQVRIMSKSGQDRLWIRSGGRCSEGGRGRRGSWSGSVVPQRLSAPKSHNRNR